MKPRTKLPTSAKHALLLETAKARSFPGTPRADMLERIGRSLERFGTMTPAMIEACAATIGST
jgi:hypothetical protein